jgi:GrpB-like predicted nucleotidyltransferase (UPF0157 family)
MGHKTVFTREDGALVCRACGFKPSTTPLVPNLGAINHFAASRMCRGCFAEDSLVQLHDGECCDQCGLRNTESDLLVDTYDDATRGQLLGFNPYSSTQDSQQVMRDGLLSVLLETHQSVMQTVIPGDSKTGLRLISDSKESRYEAAHTKGQNFIYNLVSYLGSRFAWSDQTTASVRLISLDLWLQCVTRHVRAHTKVSRVLLECSALCLAAAELNGCVAQVTAAAQFMQHEQYLSRTPWDQLVSQLTKRKSEIVKTAQNEHGQVQSPFASPHRFRPVGLTRPASRVRRGLVVNGVDPHAAHFEHVRRVTEQALKTRLSLPLSRLEPPHSTRVDALLSRYQRAFQRCTDETSKVYTVNHPDVVAAVLFRDLLRELSQQQPTARKKLAKRRFKCALQRNEVKDPTQISRDELEQMFAQCTNSRLHLMTTHLRDKLGMDFHSQ